MAKKTSLWNVIKCDIDKRTIAIPHYGKPYALALSLKRQAELENKFKGVFFKLVKYESPADINAARIKQFAAIQNTCVCR